jgi:hypothetical protein
MPRGSVSPETVIGLLWLLPISIGLIVFLTGMRNGYALHGATVDPVFLPPSFNQAVQYVREMQNQGITNNQGQTKDVAEESTE